MLISPGTGEALCERAGDASGDKEKLFAGFFSGMQNLSPPMLMSWEK